MSLESLLKPFKWMDKGIQTQYTRIGKAWENKGHSRYSLTIPLNLASWVFTFMSSLPPHIAVVIGYDMASNFHKYPYGTKDQCTSGEIAINRRLQFRLGIDKAIRFPTFIVGSAFAAKGAYHVINSLVTGESLGLSDFVDDFQRADGLLSLASSLYIKDIDPKLLDKEPILKRTYDWVKEKIIPKVPQPARFQSDTTLDTYIQSPAPY
ncbi:MAG: hypothetical protein IH934_06605 [Nanoarchaeota archaeon]|nr:hypothetical protein [Nanoarchaeota archaeon]